MDHIKRAIELTMLPRTITARSFDRAGYIIDSMIDQEPEIFKNSFICTPEYLKTIQEELKQKLDPGLLALKMGVFIPVGMWGLVEGFHFPDIDISLLGIGNHRFFLFHSAIGLWVLRRFYRLWLESTRDDTGLVAKAGQKLSGTILAAGAVGVGIHLMVDVFQPKSIVFPFFGSLIDGTLVDDNAWLLLNSLYAFKIGHDVFVLIFSRELDTARKYVRERFGNRFEGLKKPR
ncbi:MAG: hypothetical protein H0Z24_09945 [Thermosipho sp. (in: Bacteria)]|nr:hypothetical protein [Thermosipho sp. (in: thermotogales)]